MSNEGSSPKGLAKEMGPAILTRLVVPTTNLGTDLEVSYVTLKIFIFYIISYYGHLDLRRHQHQEAS